MRKVSLKVMGLFFLGSILLFLTSCVEEGEIVAFTHPEGNKGSLEEEEIIPHKVGVPRDYTWVVELEHEADDDTVDEETVTVLHNDHEIDDISVSLQSETEIHIENKAGYERGETYRIHIDGVQYDDNEDEFSPGEYIKFTTEREEVENIEFNSDIIEIENDSILELNQGTLSLRKDGYDIKENDILLLYPDFAPNGIAVKTVEVDNKFRSQTIKIQKPSFDELFEILDVYKVFELTQDYITPADGVEINEGESEKDPVELFTSVELPFGWKNQVENDVVIHFNLDELSFESENNTYDVSGEVDFTNPEILFDSQIDSSEVDKIGLIVSNEVDSLINVKLSGEEDEGDSKSTDEVIDLGEFSIPTSDPELSIDGIIQLKLLHQGDGEVDTEVTIDFLDEQGSLYEDGKSEIISLFDSDIDVYSEGSGTLTNKVGVVFEVDLSVYDVAGIGSKKTNEYHAESEAVQGESEKANGEYACHTFDAIPYVDQSFVLNIQNEDVNYNLQEDDWPLIEKDNCDRFVKSVVSVENLEMETSEEESIIIDAEYIDLLTLESYLEDIGLSTFKVGMDPGGVVDVTVMDDSFAVKALEDPAEKETTIVIEGQIDEQSVEEVVSVEITDFVEDVQPLSYIRDKSNEYVMEYKEGETTRLTYTDKPSEDFGLNEGLDTWLQNGEQSNPIFYVEDDRGLVEVLGMHGYTQIPYPIAVGETFVEGIGGYEDTVTEVDITKTTEAGTFDNVVEVTLEEGLKKYFAPNNGHILTLDTNGDILAELIEIIPR